MDFDKLFSLIAGAHETYARTIADAARTRNEWLENAMHGLDSEVSYAEARHGDIVHALADKYNDGNFWVAFKRDEDYTPADKAFLKECEATYAERCDQIEAASARHKETTGYANQWYNAAVKGAAMDFNLRLIDALAEAAK